MSKKKVEKPIKKKKEYLDFFECVHYIEKEYKLDHGDLWSWLIDKYKVSGNGSNMSLYYDEIEEMKDEKVKEFAIKLFEEFGPEDAEIEFEVYW